VDIGGHTVSGSSIPSDDDFARASAALKQRSRGLEEVRKMILAEFDEDGAVCEFFILDSSDRSFRAHVFFNLDQQIEKARQAGLTQRIEDAVFRALQTAGLGARDEIEVEFEFDSQENVERNFEGNYYNRLR
jgi:hypothetical protein